MPVNEPSWETSLAWRKTLGRFSMPAKGQVDLHARMKEAGDKVCGVNGRRGRERGRKGNKSNCGDGEGDTRGSSVGDRRRIWFCFHIPRADETRRMAMNLSGLNDRKRGRHTRIRWCETDRYDSFRVNLIAVYMCMYRNKKICYLNRNKIRYILPSDNIWSVELCAWGMHYLFIPVIRNFYVETSCLLSNRIVAEILLTLRGLSLYYSRHIIYQGFKLRTLRTANRHSLALRNRRYYRSNRSKTTDWLFYPMLRVKVRSFERKREKEKERQCSTLTL